MVRTSKPRIHTLFPYNKSIRIEFLLTSRAHFYTLILAHM